MRAKPEKPLSVVWFRNDLRINDNAALWHGASKGQVIGLFLLTAGQWQQHGMAACRMGFLLRSLKSLRHDLKALGIPLVVLRGDYFSQIPQALLSFCQQHQADAVFWNDEYPVDEQQRDSDTERLLQRNGIGVHRYHDRVIAAPGTVTRRDGEPYKVFTPFKKTWLDMANQYLPDLLPSPPAQSSLRITVNDIPGSMPGFESHLSSTLWPAGESEALQRLASFVDESLAGYDSSRDFPAQSGTSRLSPYLAVGAISPRQCLLTAWGQQGEGVNTWISELIWRDFYQHLLVAFPDLCRFKPFKPETDKIPWRNNEADFQAWCKGKTGVPIVDAGMRQLQAEGWMHNRVRMVTAMFLSKNLLLDWRLGEAFFMNHLIDGDLAANNGGWQWSASTGTDAAPYFRIFNPFTQGQRFDPGGEYIRQFVPELGPLTATQLHDPQKLMQAKPDNYPAPIVDIRLSRQAAIQIFRSVLQNNG